MWINTEELDKEVCKLIDYVRVETDRSGIVTNYQKGQMDAIVRIISIVQGLDGKKLD